MNALHAFVRPHREWIDFGYSCFDRMLLRALVQPFTLSALSSTFSAANAR
jgi:hypothetical protein